MAVDPTIDLNNTNPAAPTNGINVKWQSTGGNPDHVSAFIQGDGNTGHFLRGDGTFAAPATGGGYPVGANFSWPLFQWGQGAAGSGWGGLSSVVYIAAAEVPAFGTGLKLNLRIGTGTVKVNKAVIYKTAPGGSTILSTFQFLWSGVGNPTLTAGDKLSDSLAVTTDTSHDWYVVVFWDATTSGNIFSYDSSSVGSVLSHNAAGYLTGDFTATVPTLTSLNGFVVGISQVTLA